MLFTNQENLLCFYLVKWSRKWNQGKWRGQRQMEDKVNPTKKEKKRKRNDSPNSCYILLDLFIILGSHENNDFIQRSDFFWFIGDLLFFSFSDKQIQRVTCRVNGWVTKAISRLEDYCPPPLDIKTVYWQI